MGAEIGIAELTAHQRNEGIVLALGMAARVALSPGFVGFASGTGALVVRVAHARCGELGHPTFEKRPQLRRCDEFSGAHTVWMLPATPGEATLACTVRVREDPVGVDVDGQPFGNLVQLVGSQHG